jgi:hypothetical protein
MRKREIEMENNALLHKMVEIMNVKIFNYVNYNIFRGTRKARLQRTQDPADWFQPLAQDIVMFFQEVVLLHLLHSQ